MKTFFRGVVPPLLLASFVFFSGCPDAGTSITDNSGALVNSVWAGETPRAGDWLTITFMPQGEVVWSFSIDNSSNKWDYTFTSANTGTISAPPPWNPCPNGFAVSGNTLTVVNYGSHEGAPRDFKRLRQADFTIDPVPFTLGALAGDLAGSVWAGETPRAGDWLTITFMEAGVVVMSFSIDNSSNEWGYTFDGGTGEGTISVPSGWNPAPGGFTIDGDTLTITNYGSHEGAAMNFKRCR